MAIPALRTLQPIPLVTETGEKGFLLKDPLALSDEACVLTVPGMLIARFFDGRRSVEDVQGEFARLGGGVLPPAIIERVVELLDSHRLLDNENSRRAREAVVGAFRAEPVRRAAHAGSSYPADRAGLATMLDAFFEGEGGPGRPAPGRSRPDRLGVVVPHIDLRCGGTAAAWGYHALAEAGPFDLAVVLGVGHHATGWPYVGTTKDFETPLGVVRTDAAFVRELAGRLPFDLFDDETAHRREHSIEFQVVFLQHLYGGEPPFAIAPILCSSFRRATERGVQPTEDEPVAAFVRELARAIDAHPGRVVVIAGVDLAHVGRKFGHARPADAAFVREVEAKDRAMLERIEAGDAAGFHDFIAAERDGRNVCGHSAIYTMLAALEARRPRARLLRYDRWIEDPTESAVTFASLAVEATS